MSKTPQSRRQALLLILSFTFFTSALAHPLANGAQEEHTHTQRGGLLGRWYHDEGHHAAKLFRRDTNGSTPAVGSDGEYRSHGPFSPCRFAMVVSQLLSRSAWNAMYPGYQTPDPTQMPALWQQKLAEITQAGLIPNIPQTNAGVYPTGVDPTSKEICSAAFECQAPGDIWNAPDGMLGVSFDDVCRLAFHPPCRDG